MRVCSALRGRLRFSALLPPRRVCWYVLSFLLHLCGRSRYCGFLSSLSLFVPSLTNTELGVFQVSCCSLKDTLALRVLQPRFKAAVERAVKSEDAPRHSWCYAYSSAGFLCPLHSALTVSRSNLSAFRQL
jgi:hypothetical protein